jgi:hypothetical protein
MELFGNTKNAHKKFNCASCDYKCSFKRDWSRHILSAKHQNWANGSDLELKMPKNAHIQKNCYNCNCGKKYITQSGLWKHQKKCDGTIQLDISRQYLSDIIRDNNITRKRATFKHFPKTYRGNIRNEKEELKEFFDVINQFKLEDIISIDETSVSTSLTHNYCRAFLGDRCIKKTTNNEVFKKYSLVVAINNKKCIASELYQNGAVNAERFNEFLNKICSKVKGKLFVLDNGQIHKKESTKQIIKESGNYLVYTCPYHPRLNSIEQFFNQMKHYIKLDKPNTFTALDGSVKSSIDKIKPTNYENYFIYAYNKDYYKNKLNNKKYTRRRTLKIYKN